MNKTLKPSILALSLGAIAFLMPPSVVSQSNSPKSTIAPTPKTATAKTATTKNSAHATESLNAAGKAQSAGEVVEYKDGEDMTTRYRPGNDKTVKQSAPASSTPSTAPVTPAVTADKTKHISNIKWQDRQVKIPTCDGASKDVAKCKANPPAGPSAAKTAAPAQDSKRANKIDSFTIKQ